MKISHDEHPRKPGLLHCALAVVSFLSFQHTTIAAETVVVPAVLGGSLGKNFGLVSPQRKYQVYTVPEIDSLVSSLRNETAETAKGLRNESDAFKNLIKEQVLQTLNGISATLLSDDLKNKLSSDISDSIAEKVNGELQKFKVDLTKEILATVDDRIQKAKELQTGQQ